MKDFTISNVDIRLLRDIIVYKLADGEELSFEDLLPEDPDNITIYDVKKLLLYVLQEQIGDEIGFNFEIK